MTIFFVCGSKDAVGCFAEQIKNIYPTCSGTVTEGLRGVFTGFFTVDGTVSSSLILAFIERNFPEQSHGIIFPQGQ